MDDLSFMIFDSKTLCIASITHFTEQAETIHWMKGKAGVVEACAGSDRRRLGVTVSAQVMTDKGKGGQGVCTRDNRSREGYGGYV